MTDITESAKTFDELETSFSDTSAKEFSQELLYELQKLENGWETFAMTDYSMYLSGQKDMLQKVISYLKKVMP